MNRVRPKKHLGQHFLNNESIAQRIVESLNDSPNPILEIGPGMGVLTDFMVKGDRELSLIDIDSESVKFLFERYPGLHDHIIEGDFLKLDLESQWPKGVSIIGNFPYNISSQIFFKILENRKLVDQAVGMIQKEVALRIASKPGNKVYGILSVLLQAYYDIEYLFEVNPESFNPPPKVDSAVIRLKRNETQKLDCNESLFVKVVKQGFQTRRKTLRNALKPINLPEEMLKDEVLDLRAERLSVQDFVALTNRIESTK